MSEMTLPSRNWIQNSNPGDLRPNMLPEDPHNIEFYEWMEKKHSCFFQIAETGERTPNSSVKGSSANHYPRAPPILDLCIYN